ncbi:MAG: response regulator [Rhodospirillales bacterium]|nr:response regulator [Rhodospirillales bacterium]
MAKTILIVEDNALNMKLFDGLLQSAGYETIKSVDGSDVLEIANNLRPDLIIMDIQLPGRSGLELTKDLKADEELKHIPIIAVTAFAMKGDEKKILEAGCDDYIPKPISIPTFLMTVVKHLS